MKIRKVDFVEGARNARGSVVIIDVFRAFSTACYAFAGGVTEITAVAEIECARRLKQEDPARLLVGERHGKMIEGFDFGNSPTEMNAADLRGRSLIHTTHAGTQGLVNARAAHQLFTGSFVNAKATVNQILAARPSEVFLVRMGLGAIESSDEDDLCSDYFESLLLGKPFDINAVKTILTSSTCSHRFFDKHKPWNPESDFHLCLEIDKFDFALRANIADRGSVRLSLV